jgi:hypothetical protein
MPGFIAAGRFARKAVSGRRAFFVRSESDGVGARPGSSKTTIQETTHHE